MKRHSHTKKVRRHHFCLLVNKQATNYNERAIKKLVKAILNNGHHFTVLEPNSAFSLYDQAQSAAGLKRHRGVVLNQVKKWGNISALIACGGDGTFNLVARAGFKSNLPVAVLPMGKFNNLCQSVYKTIEPDKIIKKILARKIQTINVGKIADQMFFSSIALGFIPKLQEILEEKKQPRFSFGWSQLGTKAATVRLPQKTILKVDSFKFETSSKMINVNLLPLSCGIPISNASLPDDGKSEIIFDINVSSKKFGNYLSQIIKGKFVYGSDFRMYRGKSISIEPVEGYNLYLDGEIIKVPSEMIEISILEKDLKIFA